MVRREVGPGTACQPELAQQGAASGGNRRRLFDPTESGQQVDTIDPQPPDALVVAAQLGEPRRLVHGSERSHLVADRCQREGQGAQGMRLHRGRAGEARRDDRFPGSLERRGVIAS